MTENSPSTVILINGPVCVCVCVGGPSMLGEPAL